MISKIFPIQKNIVINCFLMLVALAFAIYLQTETYANRDATWLLHCTQLILNGGKYYNDFLETNPPLILFLYMPALAISHLFHWTTVFALDTYVFLLIIGILIYCNYWLKQIFENNDELRRFILVTLLFSFAVLPLFWFTEREQFTLLLVFPYLLMMVQRIKNYSISKPQQFITGLLAGIGFAIKPYFLFPLILIELFYLVKTQQIKNCFRLESITIFVFMLLYLISVVVFFPEYFSKILPLVSAVYIPVKNSFFVMFKHYLSAMLLLGTLVILCYPHRSHREFFHILLLAMLGFWLAYICQGRIWYYHYYPVLGLIVILLSTICYEWFGNLINKQINILNNLKMLIVGFGAFLLLIFHLVIAFEFNLHYFFDKKNPRSEISLLNQFANQHANHQNILFISTISWQEFTRYYSNANIVSRTPAMFYFTGIRRLEQLKKVKEYQALRSQFFNILLGDIKKRTPKYILIDQNGYSYQTYNFAFLPFLMSDTRFSEVFRNYHLHYRVAGFDIYERQ